MFSYDTVMAGSRPVEPPTGDVGALVAAASQQIAGRALRIAGRSKPFFFPKGDDARLVGQLLSNRLPCFGTDAEHFAATRDLLFRPHIAVQTRSGDNRSFALACVYNLPDSDASVLLRIDIAEGDAYTIDASFASDEDIPDFLELFFLDAEPEVRRVDTSAKKGNLVAWIGGSAVEGDTPQDWVEQVEAAMAVRELGVTAYQQPYRNFQAVRQAVHDARPGLLVVWLPYAGDSSGWTDLRSTSGVVINVESGAFQDALAEAKGAVDEALDRVRSPASPESSTVTRGEVRIFKKLFSTPGYDRFVETDDCGHSQWTPAHKAPKATKGIDRAVRHGGIRSLEKCLVCTGGGRWRVTFD